MLTYVYTFLHALIFSATIEGLVVFGLASILKKNRRLWLIAVLGTMCTIPYVWFVFPTLLWYSSSFAVICAESFAFLFEALLYKVLGKLSWKYALVFSCVANAASYFLGKLLA